MAEDATFILIGYRRTVLVIWPVKRADDLLEDYSLEDRMIDKLYDAWSGEPRTRAREDALKFLLSLPQDSEFRHRAARSACGAAAGWQDRDLWVQVFDHFNASGSLAVLGADTFAISMQQLGVDTVLP